MGVGRTDTDGEGVAVAEKEGLPLQEADSERLVEAEAVRERVGCGVPVGVADIVCVPVWLRLPERVSEGVGVLGWDGVVVGVEEQDSVGVGVGTGDRERESVAVGEKVQEGLGEAESDGEGEGERLPVREPVTVGLGDSLGEGLLDGVGVGWAVGDGVGVREKEGLGEEVGDGVVLGLKSYGWLWAGQICRVGGRMEPSATRTCTTSLPWTTKPQSKQNSPKIIPFCQCEPPEKCSSCLNVISILKERIVFTRRRGGI